MPRDVTMIVPMTEGSLTGDDVGNIRVYEGKLDLARLTTILEEDCYPRCAILVVRKPDGEINEVVATYSNDENAEPTKADPNAGEEGEYYDDQADLSYVVRYTTLS